MSRPSIPHVPADSSAERTANDADAEAAAHLWAFTRAFTGGTKESTSAAESLVDSKATGTGTGRQRSNTAPPVMRIYRHALECILGMLTLGDLAPILAVSREWAAAVVSMKPIRGVVERHNWGTSRETDAFRRFHPIANLVGSPLLRHIATIQVKAGYAIGTSLDNSSLGLLAQHTPNLTSLWCALTLTPDEPIILPATLTSLNIQLKDAALSDAAINGVLTTLAGLPSLSHLFLGIAALGVRSAGFGAAFQSGVDLSLLAGCRSLTDLQLGAVGRSVQLTDAQIEQIRSTLLHLQRFDAGGMLFETISRLLHLPVTARWQDIGRIMADEHTGGLLLRLPSLTTLNLNYFVAISNFDFLPQLPLLTALSLGYTPGSFSVDSLVASLLRCSGLTELHCEFACVHWSSLFAHLRLKKLTIGPIDTLQCLAEGPITLSLEDLTLRQCSRPPSEIAHLYGLHRLRALQLNNCFSPCLDEATIERLSPPTMHLPALTSLSYHWPDANTTEWIIGNRTGASFDWMRQRMGAVGQSRAAACGKRVSEAL